MSLFRVYVDGALFYHPQMSKLAITAARIEEDAEARRFRYLNAKYELDVWMTAHGQHGLSELLDRLNGGADFTTAYEGLIPICRSVYLSVSFDGGAYFMPGKP